MPLTPLKLGLVSKTFYYTPVWAAMEHGFFIEEGLDVVLHYIGNESQADALMAGSLHIAIAPPEGILQDVQSGGSLRMIAGNSGKLSHLLMSVPDVRTIEALRGRTFGILSMTEGSFFHFQVLAETHGLFYPGDYCVQETGGAPARHAALLAGEIDAGLQSVPWCFIGEDKGLNRLADISDYVPDWQFNTVNADSAWCRAHPGTTRAALRALQRGVDWVYANRTGCAAMASRRMDIDEKYTLQGWDYFNEHEKLTRDMTLDASGLASVIAAQVRAGLLPAGVSTDVSTYADPSWLPARRSTATTTGDVE